MMKKKSLCLLLVLGLLMALAVPAAAADTDPWLNFGGTVENPLYADVELPAELDVSPEASEEEPQFRVFSFRKEVTYVDPMTAADQLRACMVNRQESVTLNIETADFWGNSATDNWFTRDFLPLVFLQELSTGPYDGDYLMWSWFRYSWQITSHSGNDYVFEVKFQYYTDAAQEQALQEKISVLVNELNLQALEPAAAYEAIYDYITNNVSYDYAGLSTIHDSDPDNNDYMIYTAYGALMDGEAVCQGYSTLFYAFCRAAELPVRVVTSTNHAWNIVYLLNRWYCVDATWDSSTSSHREWFLTGLNTFETRSDHTRTAEYQAEAFLAEYPLSLYDYNPDCPYSDVDPASCHYPDICDATALGLFNGTAEYTFSPRDNITRGQLVTVLWRMEGEPKSGGSSFDDVVSGSFYAEAVSWAAEQKIVNGFGDGTFQPNAPATREQFVAIFYRYANYLKLDASASADLSVFTDRQQVSNFAQTPMQWAVGTGLVKGTTTTTLSPRNPTTRAQMASLFCRLIRYYALA